MSETSSKPLLQGRFFAGLTLALTIAITAYIIINASKANGIAFASFWFLAVLPAYLCALMHPMMARSEICHVDVVTRNILDGRTIGLLQRQGTLSIGDNLTADTDRDTTLVPFDRDGVIDPRHHGAMVRHEILLSSTSARVRVVS